MRVRVRGIYSTALTRRFLDAGHEVVQPSLPIEERFDTELEPEPYDVSLESTADRQGVVLTGASGAVDRASDVLADLAIDTFVWEDPAPRGAVFDSVVTDTLGGGAVVDLGDREGYLPYGNVDGRVEADDVVRVQVHEASESWTNGRPVVGESRHAHGGLATLRDDLDGTRVNADDDAARELQGMTDLLDVERPPNWGVEWARAAVDAELDALRASLERAVDRAMDLIGLDDDRDPPRRLVAPEATAWCWFGRETRFALDADRAAVTTTMPGHHRIKAGSKRASTAVDFVEAVCTDPGDSFDFGAVTGQFGPREDDRIAIEHGKPDGRLFTLGRGEVRALDADGSVTIRREMSGSGSYDALGTPRESGDLATTRLKEGRWWYATKYTGEDGENKGTYANVCTPVEVFPDAIRYVDLHVDVVKYPDGTVERVDDDELDDAVDAGHVSPALAEKARSVAGMLESALAD